MLAFTVVGDMMGKNHRYEAWRNLVLILAGILIGYSFDSFGTIRQGIRSLTEFDRAFPTTTWPSLLSVLIVVYVAKNAHGILITLYDDHYEEKLHNNIGHVVVSWILTAVLIISFALVCRMSELVDDGKTLEDRCLRLVTFTLFPNIVLFLFDVFHVRAFEYSYGGGAPGLLKRMAREICRNPLRRGTHQGYKTIWLAENLLNILIVTFWLIMLKYVDSPPTIILITAWTLGVLLVINSVVDYFLNCRYFFFGSLRLGGVLVANGSEDAKNDEAERI